MGARFTFKNALWLVAVLLVSASATFAFVSSQNSSTPTEDTATTESTDATPEEQGGTTAPMEPNVLLIILDDIGLDYFPGFLKDEGFDKASMPVIEGLMERANVFHGLHTYAMCSPTRASLLTGMHGVETGVLDPGRTSYLDPQFSSVQEELKSLSGGTIATSVFGKWHIAGRDGGLDHPGEFGIDHYAGIIEGNHDDYSNWTQTVNGVQSQSSVYSTTQFTNDAIDWIAEQDGQWFSWLAYTAPHTPLHAPPSALHSYDLPATASERQIRQNAGDYFKAMLQSVDTEIGRLLDSMDPATRDSTYVMIIGDNGTDRIAAQAPYADVGVKGTLQAGGIRTPMIVINPSNEQRVDHDQLVSTIDFYPTIVELFGLKQQSERAGTSFAPLLGASASKYMPHEYVFSQNLEAVAVSSGQYKLIQQDVGSDLFYDVAADPFEQQKLNLASLTGVQQAKYDQLVSALERFAEGSY